VSSEIDAAPPLDETTVELVAVAKPEPELVSAQASAEELEIARDLVRSARARAKAMDN
jgi:hypothetical protein